MKKWRLLDTGALPASLNMAIDEALLQLHVPGKSQPILRFYQWSPPAVSLGYFQEYNSIDISACGRCGLDIVRRTTGGRAVLHENDLTYSVIADSEQGIPFSLNASYRLLCKGLMEGFRLLGFETELGREKPVSSQEDICFVHAAIGDIVFQRKKFVGSAQTWRGRSLLQHGSIVLESQEETWMAIIKKTESLELMRGRIKERTTALRNILGRPSEIYELKLAIVTGMGQTLNVDFKPGTLESREWKLAEEIASKKRFSF